MNIMKNHTKIIVLDFVDKDGESVSFDDCTVVICEDQNTKISIPYPKKFFEKDVETGDVYDYYELAEKSSTISETTKDLVDYYTTDILSNIIYEEDYNTQYYIMRNILTEFALKAKKKEQL